MKTLFTLALALVMLFSFSLNSVVFAQKTFIDYAKASDTWSSADLTGASNGDYFVAFKTNNLDSCSVYCSRLNKNGKKIWDARAKTSNIT